MHFLLRLIPTTLALVGLSLLARGNDAAVIINEIHYHPLTGDTEWIELHSLTGVDIDLSGWKLANAVDYTFSEGAKIPGHGFVVIAATPNAFSLNGLGALGPWTGALNNSAETIELLNHDARVMDSITYSDGGDWPNAADGSGATLARRNSEIADPNASGWAASADTGGTPGRSNFAVVGQAATVTTASDLDSTWKYFTGTPPAGWQQPAFDDSAWGSGASLFYTGTPTLGGGTDGLAGYWPLDSISGGTTANLAPGGAAAGVAGLPTIVSDGSRGNVIQFSADGQRVSAGSDIIPQMTLTNDFSWSFWANSTQQPGSNVIIGNRYSPVASTDWTPREFIKFTPTSFEFHRGGVGDDLNYADIAANSGWIHHAMVKTGATLTYYRNGVVAGTHTITQGQNHPQPLYFGGEQAQEFWTGKLDDVAIWSKALTGAQIGNLTSGAATPLNVSSAGALHTVLPTATTYAFRRTFSFTGTPSRTALTLKLLAEDGCTVWLNGTQVYTQNNPPTSGTAAANISTDIAIPNSALVKGNNVIAVQVATFASDPDMVFGAQLTLSETEPSPADTVAGLVFNEISAGGAGFKLELANLGASTLNLAGYSIRSSTGASYSLTDTLAAGGYLTVTAAQLAFTPVKDDKLFLIKAGGIEVLDGRKVTGKLRGLSTQYPGRWLFPSSATFGTANTFVFNNSIVINEVMYEQRPLTQSPFAADPEQWVELHNRSASPVVLTGWTFSAGISYSFPTGTTIAAGDYLVVSNNATALQAKWPGVAGKIIGNFSSKIKHGGELLQIADALGNPVNETSLGNSAPWPAAAGGGGSSLELRDPRADNTRPEAWAASNEAYRGSWQTYTFQTTAAPANGNDPTTWNEFIFGLLDTGSMMIDDISVTQGSTQLILNGGFNSNTTGWRCLGTHSRASVVSDPFGSGNVLRVDATGASEHMHNHCETMLQSSGAEHTINNNLTYTVSFRARWVSGSPLLNTRLYFDRIARTSVLPVAAGGGTPGAANTARITNLGPTFSGLSHSPVVPAANQAATVSVTAGDPDNLGAVTLFYAVNGGSFTNTAMTTQGSGRYTAAIPGQAAGAKVQFYVQAADSLGVTGTAPALGVNSRAIIPWDDGQARLTVNSVKPNNIRIVMTAADTTILHTPTNVMNNDTMGCTVIWNESEAYYDCGTHLHGSERGRNQPARVSFNLRFPTDHLLLGAVDSCVIDRGGSGNEIMIKRAITHAGGIPGSEDDLCRVIAPQSAQTGSAIFGRQRIVTGEYLDSAYANGGDGNLFKYELIYYPTTTTGVNGPRGNPQNLKYPEPDNVTSVPLTSLGSDKEAYRWHWLISNHEDADDYSGLTTFLTAFGRSSTPDAQYYTDTNAMIDVSEWLRSFAIETLFGVADNYGTGSTHNFYTFRRPSDSRWIFMPYDMDYSFSNGTTSTMFPNGDLVKLVSNTANLRMYWAHVYDICQTSFSTAYLTGWAEHYSNFVPEDLTQYMSYVDARRTYALGKLNTAIPSVPFAITTPSGTAPGPTVPIAGDAWVDVAQMRLAGSSLPLNVTWLSSTTWQTNVTIAQGPNPITINAYNSQGVQIGTSSVTITGNGTIVPADSTNLVISEIMYHPGPPSAAELSAGYTDPDLFEYVELQNISPTATISLANCQFTAGLSSPLPSVVLSPGARALVVGNQAAFTLRYGSGFNILGAYQPTTYLSNNGDHIILLNAQGQPIRDFSYEEKAPWPDSADGDGFSLVLINPAANPDHSKPVNWRASVALNGNPGTSDSTTFSGNALGDDNGDGIVNLLQYALAGTNPATLPTFTSEAGFLTFRYNRNLAADDITYTVQRTTNLATWANSPSDVIYLGETHNADGTSTYTWRSASLQSANPREFMRLKVAK
ncbi:MAG: lamin tail domain-containing protein [Luteolibacter sp.]|uniref:lamin tail domain-containing protein n=1 Tax=Luteolibacter sp. TaxID=1962973 RepID=UPI003265F472